MSDSGIGFGGFLLGLGGGYYLFQYVDFSFDIISYLLILMGIGIIDVNLPDIDYSVDRTRNKIGETNGFSSKEIQITIKADTTIGAIDLN